MLNFAIIFIFLLGNSASAISQPKLAKARFALNAPQQIKSQLSAQELNGELQVIEDENLKACIKETAMTQNLDSLQDLTTLKCVNKSIETVNGIKILNKLTKLNLKSNKISSISRLYDSKFPNLETINVLNNPSLFCRNIKRLKENNPNLLVINNCQNTPRLGDLNFKDPNFSNSIGGYCGHGRGCKLSKNKKAGNITFITNQYNNKVHPISSLKGINQLNNLHEVYLYGGKNNSTNPLNLNPLKKLNLTELLLDNLAITDWDWNLPKVRSISIIYTKNKNFNSNFLDQIAVNKFPELEYLTLGKEDQTSFIDSITIDGQPKLSELHFHNIVTKDIKLTNNPNLYEVHFIGNLDKLEIDSVEELYLSINNISTLEVMTPIQNLRELSCAPCKLQSLSGFPSNGSTIQNLYFGDNKLENLNGLPASLPNLSYANFSNNKLRNLNGLDLSFDQEYPSPYLQLNNNLFTDLNLLNHLSGKIDDLTLSSNLITGNGTNLNLKSNLFIDSLQLDSNKISKLSWIKNALKDKHVKRISLENNNIQSLKELEDIPFINNDYSLYLNSNAINSTAKFLGSSNGGYMNLSNNLISDLDFLQDNRNINLSGLNLSNNLLDDEDIKVFDSLISRPQNFNIEYLDLSYNQITNINPLINLLQSKNHFSDSFSSINLSNNKISNISNLDLTAIKSLSELDLSYNEIQKITKINIYDNQASYIQTYLKLHNNKISAIDSLTLNFSNENSTYFVIYLTNNLLEEMPVIDLVSTKINVDFNPIRYFEINASDNKLTSIRKLIDHFKSQNLDTNIHGTFNFYTQSIPQSEIEELRALGFVVFN